MALIEPLEPDGDPQFEAMIEHYRQTSGFVPNGLLAMRRRPEIQKAVQNLHKAAMASHPGSRVTPELKVLLAHLASRAAGTAKRTRRKGRNGGAKSRSDWTRSGNFARATCLTMPIARLSSWRSEPE